MLTTLYSKRFMMWFLFPHGPTGEADQRRTHDSPHCWILPAARSSDWFCERRVAWRPEAWAIGTDETGDAAYTLGMSLPGDPFERLEKLIFRPVSTRPDWLKAWRHEAQHLLFLARRAVDDDDEELLQELEDQAREMGDMVEARLTAEGL